MDHAVFNETIWQFYAQHGRHDLPWRQSPFDPYQIVVSELMLQQTQVGRVIPKFHEFIQMFPTVQTLAAAPLADVLTAWSGLGYNRRAKFLWQTAQAIDQAHDGQFPSSLDELVRLPGIGKNTAGAIMAYAFNVPTVFVETNIRTVYIHHFFQDQSEVADNAIIQLIEQTLDRENPRQFYWALMDYGSNLKQTVGNLSKYSSSYTKQSKFNGSKRQIRGQVIKLLAAENRSRAELGRLIPDERLSGVLQDLVDEKLIQCSNDTYSL